MLDGVSTDRVEGEALKFKHYWVDIYSNSWGPKDDGQTLEPLGQLTTHALVDGITEVTEMYYSHKHSIVFIWTDVSLGQSTNCVKLIWHLLRIRQTHL